MLHLENTIQNYAWGSHSAISRLLGAPTPSQLPEAELWLGAHPKAPSRVSSGEPLDQLIKRDPGQLLGARVEARFGPQLPFLLKVLAAESPLSLQAHPTRAQARAGFDAENQRGIALDSPERNYRDANHKPELICALSPFAALCGFRATAQSQELVSALRAPRAPFMTQLLARLRSDADLPDVFSWLMSLPAEQRQDGARQTLDRCTDLAAFEGPFQHEFSWAVRVGMLYPDDIGVVTMLLLNLVRLMPGEALYLPAGNLHGYLQGVGIELMANSDNVLRGGLTPKHVDVPEFTRILDFTAGPVPVLQGEMQGSARVYQTTAPDFELQSYQLCTGEAPVATDRRGPEIVLCEQGQLELECERKVTPLAQGESLFIDASEPAYTIRGEGRLFRACVGRF